MLFEYPTDGRLSVQQQTPQRKVQEEDQGHRGLFYFSSLLHLRSLALERREFAIYLTPVHHCQVVLGYLVMFCL
jgi:hypothetical protein